MDGIRRAQNAVNTECERLLDEYEAFLEFAERVAGIPVATRPDGGRAGCEALAVGPQNDGGLQEVRDVYRETVMDVPHFEADYDEPLEKHMAAEFAPEVAAAIAGGSQFTSTVRGPLLASAKSASRDRRVLVDELTEEISDLEAAEDQLLGIARRFEVTNGDGLANRRYPDLQARWRRLGDLQAECESLLERRQSQLRERGALSATQCRSPTDVSTYLYGGLDVDFPVLATATSLLNHVEAEKDHTVEALTRRRL